MNRRTVVMWGGSTSVMALAGCSALFGGNGIPDLYIQNGGTDGHSIEFRVTLDEETVLQDAIELEPDESASYDDPFTEAGAYSITVSTNSGLEETFSWDEMSEPAEGDSDGLQVRIETETITFDTVTA